MRERPPEISWLCTAKMFVPARGVAAMDQLEVVAPGVRVATPVTAEAVARLDNEYTTLVRVRLVGFTPGNKGEGVAVPWSNGELVRALGIGDEMKTSGACRARNSAAKTRLDCMRNWRVGLKLITPSLFQFMNTEDLGLAVME